MSLFDILRYPISYYPTVAELVALPRPLFDQWVRESVWGSHPSYRKTPEGIGDYYEEELRDATTGRREFRESDQMDIALLRKMIAEYDDI